jgi:hypothetical protein
LAQKAARTAINDAVKRMQREACIRALRAALAKEPHAILQRALDAYIADEALTPKQLNVVFWRLDTTGIEYRPSFFKVDMKARRRMEDLEAMPDYQRARVWRALTSAQRKAALARDISAPAQTDNSR